MSPKEPTEEIEAKAEVKKPSSTKQKVKEQSKGMTKEEIITAIKSKSVMDLADLVKDLESEFGVSAAPVAIGAPVAVATPSQPSEVPPEEEKSEFSITLKAIGEKKIEVIKAVREVTDLGLKQAKDLVEAAPQIVKENVLKEEAATIKQKLEDAGASVEIK